MQNVKIKQPLRREGEVQRDEKAWQILRGIWRGKKIANPVQWQRKIRKEWERTAP